MLHLLSANGTVVTISSDSNLHVSSMQDLNSEIEYRPHTIYARWTSLITIIVLITNGQVDDILLFLMTYVGSDIVQ